MLEILRIAALVCGAVVVGGVLAEAAILLPLLRTLVPENALRAFRYIGPRAFATYVPCALITSFALTLMLFQWSTLGDASQRLLLPALALQWAAVATTVVLYVPLQTKLRTAESPPPDYQRILGRAVAANASRTAMFLAAWLLLVVSIVVD
jgi:hypothetical protein